MAESKPRLAIVIGALPTVEEIDQFQLLKDEFEINVVSSESICGYLTKTSCFENLTCIALPDYDENPSYIPGLEKVLSDFKLVIVKERLGLYAYQAVKAKWKSSFKLIVWVDNLTPFAAEDIDQMRIVRNEISSGADAFLVQTKAARMTLEAEGITSDKIFEFTPWVARRVDRDPKTKAEALAALKMPEGTVLVGYIGQIEWEEGLSQLAIAMSIAVKQNESLKRRLKLIISGIGSYSSDLHQELKALGIEDRVSYLAPERNATTTILAAIDALYISSTPCRDRNDGDPYRVMMAMANEIPILAPRTPVVEEYCGKHRLDFCQNSPMSIAKTLEKLEDAVALKHDITKKNFSVITRNYSAEVVSKTMMKILGNISISAPSFQDHSLLNQVMEIEARVKNGQFIEAVDSIEAIFRRPNVPVHIQANLHRLIGDSFAKLDDSESAKAAYIKAVNLDPYSAKVYIGLGTLGLIKGVNDVAVIHFQKAISLAPADEMANLGLGMAFHAMHELKEASRWVLKSLQISPFNLGAIFELVKISHAMSRYNEIEVILSHYIDKHPNDFNMIYTLGGIKFKEERYDAAIELMMKIIRAVPNDTRAHALLKQARDAAQSISAIGEG